MEFINVKNWFPTVPSSIYATVKTLEKKGLIEGSYCKTGNMPERKVYTITESGKKCFINTLEHVLSDPDVDFVMLNLGLIFICHIEQKKVIRLLNNKIERLMKRKETQLQKLSEMDATMPFSALQAIKNMQNMTAALILSTTEMMCGVTDDKQWNYFIAKSYYKEA